MMLATMSSTVKNRSKNKACRARLDIRLLEISSGVLAEGLPAKITGPSRSRSVPFLTFTVLYIFLAAITVWLLLRQVAASPRERRTRVAA